VIKSIAIKYYLDIGSVLKENEDREQRFLYQLDLSARKLISNSDSAV